MYELVDFARETTELAVTGIRFIQGDSSKQYALVASCKCLYVRLSVCIGS